MEASIHKRKRILLHFLLGIGLPSLLLGYLAFRGVKNDLALLEKERLNKHNAIAQKITESINQKISTVEENFLDSIPKDDTLQQDPSVFHSLEHLKNQQPIVEEIFLLENAKDIQLPLAKLLYFPGTSVKSLPEQSHLSALLPGHQYEFQEKRLQEALVTYQRVFAQTSDSELKGKVLNAIARVQKKSNLFLDAIKSYTTIAQDYNDFRLGSGLPSGLVAQLELDTLFLEVDDPNNAAQNFINLYKDLIHGEWETVDTHIGHLRKKIEDDPANPRHIIGVRGIGYKFIT